MYLPFLWKILLCFSDLQKIEMVVQSSHMPCTQVPLLATEVHSLFRFFLVLLNIFFWIPGCHMTSSCQIFLGSSWLWQCLRLLLFLMTWQFWGLDRYVVGGSSVGIFLMFFSWFRPRLWVLGDKDHKGECQLHHIVSRVHYQPWLVWLSGLGTSLRTKGWLLGFPVSAHAGVAARSPVGGVCERQPHTDVSLLLLPPFPSV